VAVLRTIVLVLVLLLTLAALYLAMWPVPVDPVAWYPEPAPELVGPYEPNQGLVASRRLIEDHGTGPEDVAFDGLGNLYTGFDDGDIVRVPMAGGEPEVFVNTGGRPLGMMFDDRGMLIVADAFRGLLSIAPDGRIITLAASADDVLFGFADDIDIAPDGIIYLSDVSTKFGYGSDAFDIVEHRPHGRLIAYDPEQRKSKVVLDGLHFANGVAVALDGSYVLVAETSAYQIQRLWLEGPKAGTAEPFITNLPGFPDNINMTDRGTVWVALPSRRIANLDAVANKPFLREVMMRLPQSLQPAPIRYGFVVELDGDGTPIRSLQDTSGNVALVTSVMEADGDLYLGSHMEPSLVVVEGAVPVAAPEGEVSAADAG
jgi:sugar lactone lactonase YvrE